MTVFLVLSTFASSPVSLLATTKASAFFLIVCMLPPNTLTHHQHKPEADVYHLISIHPVYLYPPNGVL